jgi:hypothetical protein
MQGLPQAMPTDLVVRPWRWQRFVAGGRVLLSESISSMRTIAAIAQKEFVQIWAGNNFHKGHPAASPL